MMSGFNWIIFETWLVLLIPPFLINIGFDLSSTLEQNDSKKSFSTSVVSKFVKLKKRELKEFSSQSEEDAYDWQRNNAIDC